jgi:arginyl-tRNA synthetase
MNLVKELRERFRGALATLVDDPTELLEMVRPAQDPRFGDYQANCAMPLGKQLGRSPRDVAAEIVQRLDVGDLCEPPEIAGPGFINLRLQPDWLAARLAVAMRDPRLGVIPVEEPRSYVLDYSSPNVAKPMHVGHIRSTVIGDALCRILRFLGHRVISDNHLGDWGTQFGMIIYGYKHFRDEGAFQEAPVRELGRLYKLVSQLVDYHETRRRLPDLQRRVSEREEAVEAQQKAGEPDDRAEQKRAAKRLRGLQSQAAEARAELAESRRRLAHVEQSPHLQPLAAGHPEIALAVQQETARLHADDEENVALWHAFLPECRTEIQRIYDRLDIRFDCEHGESFYHRQLGDVVQQFLDRGLAEVSDGAVCVFLDGFEAPMIIQKSDGAYLYATTDLATIEYRMRTFEPDAILYVVDHRQKEHFDKLFAAVRRWGFDQVELQHISFGTVLGEDGKPYKTRSGDTVGLEGLLDEAVRRAYGVVCANDDVKPTGPELDDAQRRHIAEVVGHAAIKYADLSQNRTSDYVFSYDKMVALEGNTATYMQYSYARTQSIFAKGDVDVEALREGDEPILLEHPAERALGLELLRLAEAIEESVIDYRTNVVTSYLFDLARRFSEFYQQCKVLKAETRALRHSRLLLCDLTGRALHRGLDLLGIRVVDKM